MATTATATVSTKKGKLVKILKITGGVVVSLAAISGLTLAILNTVKNAQQDSQFNSNPGSSSQPESDKQPVDQTPDNELENQPPVDQTPNNEFFETVEGAIVLDAEDQINLASKIYADENQEIKDIFFADTQLLESIEIVGGSKGVDYDYLFVTVNEPVSAEVRKEYMYKLGYEQGVLFNEEGKLNGGKEIASADVAVHKGSTVRDTFQGLDESFREGIFATVEDYVEAAIDAFEYTAQVNELQNVYVSLENAGNKDGTVTQSVKYIGTYTDENGETIVIEGKVSLDACKKSEKGDLYETVEQVIANVEAEKLAEELNKAESADEIVPENEQPTEKTL